MKEKIIVTSALLYANGPLHIGHLVEYIQTDIYVRFKRLTGCDVIYVCADDTHGAPIQIHARKLGVTPKQLIDRVYKEHVRDLSAFGVKFDNYYTTDSEENRKFSDLMFERAKDKGYIYKKKISQLYCEKDKMSLPDRYVKGICPKCGAEDQYGDVCEKCGTTYKPTDLLKPYCSLCKSSPVSKESEHYFFRLSSFKKELRDWLKNPLLQKEIVNSVTKWIDDGLEDWDITRDGPYFGFKVPGEDNLYYYVWWDAPIGYIASLDNLTKKGEEYWNEYCVQHFIGKDIIYFHFLFWPAVLYASDFKLPDKINVHGFLTVNGEKMSKSRGTFFTAQEFLKKHEAEHLRYFYASALGSKLQDIDLSFDDFRAKVNNELVADIGNFCYRSLSFTSKFLNSRVDGVSSDKIRDELTKKAESIRVNYDTLNFRGAVKELLAYSSLANKFFQDNAPWNLVKTDRKTASEVLGLCINITKNIAVLMKPIMPQFSQRLESQLKLDNLSWDDIGFDLKEHIIGKPEILVQKIPDVEKFPLDLRVAEIVDVRVHPEADKLLIMQINLGTEKRQILAGLRQYYSPADLKGKKIIVVTNLKPAKLRGEESQGMLLAASKDETVKVIMPHLSEPGESVIPEGFEPDTGLISIDRFMKLNKLSVKDKQLLYDNMVLKTAAETIQIDMPDNSTVR